MQKALFSKASAKVIHFSETTKFLWIFFEKNLSFYPSWLVVESIIPSANHLSD